jgi:secondary thiamine-phosphate synthase enzyme
MIDSQVFQSVSSFRVHNETLSYTTSEAPQFIDITRDVADAIDRSEILNGMAVVFSMHTTAAIKINECEPELIKDMSRFLAEIAPLERDYYHNNFDVRTVNMEEDECPNAHSHCQHLMLSASETLPIVNGRLQVGRWQRIFLIELDRPKERRVTVQILGM